MLLLASLFSPVHTLPCRSAFQHYLIQDYVYLQYFQQAYELTIRKCDRDGHAPEVGRAADPAVGQVGHSSACSRGGAPPPKGQRVGSHGYRPSSGAQGAWLWQLPLFPV